MVAPSSSGEDEQPGEFLTELEWVELQKGIEERAKKLDETTMAKFRRKFKENPFVPIGCLGTAAALSYGLWSFRHGRRRMSQMMMRTRIVAQGFTVVAMLVGLGLSTGAVPKPRIA